ncbi:PREDICTED: uncharacterized protein LOC106744243 isoform X2 [Dinoponera quadriceps]|nr:PREDICTED: uncharacterized protein LOC106744243 isoform X2 [Dinoponera quadriceps]
MPVETPEWLNVSFMQKALRKSEGDDSIHVIDIFTKPATDKGDNYTSDMIRVTVEYSQDQAGRKVTKKKTVIVKISPIAEGIRKDLITNSSLFITEMLMMSDTLEKMNQLLKHPLSAKCLYIQKQDPQLLVIEDLAPLGFRMADREAGLDLAHCTLALRGLAKFHASSVALCEKEPSQKDMDRKGMFSPDHPEELTKFFSLSLKSLAKEVTKWPELDKKYSAKLDNFSKKIYKIGSKLSRQCDDDFNVINHGDFWVNNMLFKYSDGKPIDHIFVDFQLCSYTSPAIDLLYFLGTSPSMEIIENNKDVLLNEYLNTLSSTMKQLGCKTQPPTMEKLKKSLKERAAYEMIASFTILPIVLCKKADVKGFDEIMSKDGSYDNPGFQGKIFKKIMLKRIPLYDEQGLLD